MRIACIMSAMAYAWLQCGTALAAVETLPGGSGYCIITRDGSGFVSQPDDYLFTASTGQITLKTVGTWELTYQSTDTPGDPYALPVDVYRIERSIADLNGDLRIRANGANLAASIYLPSIAVTGAKELSVHLTGGFLSGAGISAGEFTLTDCVIARDVPAASNGITASTVADTSGVGLQIGGEGADYVKLGGSAGLVPSPGVHVRRECRACGLDLHATC
jgi:hypothetical protein